MEAVNGLPIQLDDKGRTRIDVPDDTGWTGRRSQFLWQINDLSHSQV
jgi:hypothetical protein